MKSMIKAGLISSVSIGAFVRELEKVEDEAGEYLLAKNLDIVELSLVGVPADKDAGFAMACMEAFNLKQNETISATYLVAEESTVKQNLVKENKEEIKMDSTEEKMAENDLKELKEELKSLREEKAKLQEEQKIADLKAGLNKEFSDLKEKLMKELKEELETKEEAKEIVEEKPQGKAEIAESSVEKTEKVENINLEKIGNKFGLSYKQYDPKFKRLSRN